MPIRFPRMHIADSVVNRILNAADGLGITPRPSPTPDVPLGDEPLGAAIERASTEPTPDLEDSGNPLAGSVARGDNLVDGL